MKYYDCISKVSIATMKVMKTQASKNITTLRMCLDYGSVIEFGACHRLSNKELLWIQTISVYQFILMIKSVKIDIFHLMQLWYPLRLICLKMINWFKFVKILIIFNLISYPKFKNGKILKYSTHSTIFVAILNRKKPNDLLGKSKQPLPFTNFLRITKSYRVRLKLTIPIKILFKRELWMQIS